MTFVINCKNAPNHEAAHAIREHAAAIGGDHRAQAARDVAREIADEGTYTAEGLVIEYTSPDEIIEQAAGDADLLAHLRYRAIEAIIERDEVAQQLTVEQASASAFTLYDHWDTPTLASAQAAAEALHCFADDDGQALADVLDELAREGEYEDELARFTLELGEEVSALAGGDEALLIELRRQAMHLLVELYGPSTDEFDPYGTDAAGRTYFDHDTAWWCGECSEPHSHTEDCPMDEEE